MFLSTNVHLVGIPGCVKGSGGGGVHRFALIKWSYVMNKYINQQVLTFLFLLAQNMAESFLDGGVQLDSFVDEYLLKRKLAHLRRVKIEKLQEMVLKGQRLPQVSVLSQPKPAESVQAPPASYPSGFNTPLAVAPRRAVPPPPSTQAGMYPTPFAMAAQQPAPGLPYAASPTPPIPPRVGYPPIAQMPQPGYPNPFAPQYPPALPQRPPQRLPPNPGFIL